MHVYFFILAVAFVSTSLASPKNPSASKTNSETAQSSEVFAEGEDFVAVHFDGKNRFLQQVIYYPKDIASRGPLPLIVISHGNGHNYKQYKHLQETLAPRGYVVMSHANQTGPGIKTAAQSTLANTDLFLGSLEDIQGGVLSGKVDSTRIGFIGHSRGGEGVVRAYTRLQNGDFIPDHFARENVQFLSSIAPTTFLAAKQVNPGNVNYNLFVGGADGDVNGTPQRVVMSMPIYERGRGEKTLIYLQGAGHNVFNDSSRDEGQGPSRLERSAVLHISKVVHLALADLYLKNHSQWRPFFQKNWAVNPFPGLPEEPRISNEYKRPLSDTAGFVVDNFQVEKKIDKASSGANMSFTVKNVFEGVLQDQDRRFRYSPDDTMNGLTRYIDSDEPPVGLSFEWDNDSHLTFDFSEAPKDLAGLTAVSMRAAQMSRHPYTQELLEDLHFSLALVDTAGQRSRVVTEDFGKILLPYQRLGGWATEFSVLRIDLENFALTNPNLNLSSIQKLEFLFGPSEGSPMGSLVLDDVEFVK